MGDVGGNWAAWCLGMVAMAERMVAMMTTARVDGQMDVLPFSLLAKCGTLELHFIDKAVDVIDNGVELATKMVFDVRTVLSTVTDMTVFAG